MAMRDFLAMAAIVLAVLSGTHLGSAFTASRTRVAPPQTPQGVAPQLLEGSAPEVAAPVQGSLSARGLFGFGLCFGVAFAAMGRTITRVSLRAADIEVADKSETKPAAYLDNIPPSLVDKKTLDRLLAITPKEKWDNPDEDSPLYIVKVLSETYGPGKATKMRYSDYWYLKNQIIPDFDDLPTPESQEKFDETFNRMMMGKAPLQIPGPAGFWNTTLWLNWRGKEPFAGDQVQSIVSDSRITKQFLDNLAFFRAGLKPWQRGLEIGMAHGYFLIGPFTSLGPLRNTPEAATIGLLCAIAIVGFASTGGILFGTVVKPTLFDKPGEKPAKGWDELMVWHGIGGIGGAAFAHLLITIFAQ